LDAAVWVRNTEDYKDNHKGPANTYLYKSTLTKNFDDDLASVTTNEELWRLAQEEPQVL
jgi:hypothetical protein